MREYDEKPELYSLNDGWRFLEQDLSFLPEGRQHDSVYAYAKCGGACGPAASDYNDETWKEVTLPHDWVTEHAFDEEASPSHGYKKRGIAWYRLQFSIPEAQKGKIITLEFDGMSADAVIFFNGSVVKRSFSGYNSIYVDVTDMANYGVVVNTLAVRIDASAWEGWWYEGAGIYRNVWLQYRNPVHIAHTGTWYRSSPVGQSLWHLVAEITVENDSSTGCDYEVAVTVSRGNRVIAGSTQQVCTNGYEKTVTCLQMQVDQVERWSCETPNLYAVQAVISQKGRVIDYKKENIGFRTIRLDAAEGFFLNGQPLKLQGFCNHQDHAGLGVAVPYPITEYRLQLLKNLGANAIRQAHNPSPDVLAACDRLGLLVMEENRRLSTEPDNLAGLEDLIKNARNHPCVAFYSLFNEEPLQGSEKGRKLAERMYAHVRKLDQTRPITAAFNGGYLEDSGAGPVLDAVGMNYNPARYDDFHQKYPEQPLLASETACELTVRGVYEQNADRHELDNYDAYCAPWGNTIRDAWKYVQEKKYVAGMFAWTGLDYRGEPTPFTWPSKGSFFGALDSCGFPKDVAYLYKAFWSKMPVIHLISPWTKGPESSGAASDQMLRVLVATNCEEVALSINGHIVETKKTEGFYSQEFTVPWQKGCLKAVGRINGKNVVTDAQYTAGKPEELRIELSREFFWKGQDAIAANILLTDADGTILSDADAQVTLVIANGVIKGVGNGDPNGRDADTGTKIHLFHGCAQAILQASGKDIVEFQAFTEEITSRLITVPVRNRQGIPAILPSEVQAVADWKMYYRTGCEKPDVQLALQETSSDQNSFEPVTINGQPQSAFSERIGEYGLYRADLQLHESYTWLFFERIVGRVWIYLDGQEAASRITDTDGTMKIPLAGVTPGKHRVAVIIQNVNPEWPQAGICRVPVLIR